MIGDMKQLWLARVFGVLFQACFCVSMAGIYQSRFDIMLAGFIGMLGLLVAVGGKCWVRRIDSPDDP